MRKYLVLIICFLLVGTAIAAERYPAREIVEGNSSTFITSADNTAVKTSPGYLVGIKVSGGTMGTVTVYDNTVCTGAESTSVVDNVAAAEISAGTTMPYGRVMTTGICVYTSAATKLVVVYR